ncbi:uncharacterized protein LOC134205293 [Armigeres subalbatus]|uniref:uncharacterized protein LOC134205293 n=1 Tax=Armigeres subalbatus TaxID=124917 RepID=UPI002ED0FD9F
MGHTRNVAVINFKKVHRRDVFFIEVTVVALRKAGCNENISTISIFPMTTDWSQCIAQVEIFAESLSYTIYESLGNYDKNQYLNIDGLLLIGISESITNHLGGRSHYEKLAMLIMRGDIDRNSGSLRKASTMFQRSIMVNIDPELSVCMLNSELTVECFTGGDLHDIARHVEVSGHSTEHEKQTLRVTQYRIDSVERPTDNAYLRLIDRPVLRMITNKLNLTPISVGDNFDYGYRMSNGTFIGSLGEVEYGRTDLARTRIMFSLHETSNVQFVVPVIATPFRYVVPKNYYPHARREVDIIALSLEFMLVYYSILFWFPIGFRILEYYSFQMALAKSNSKTPWISSVFMTYATMTNISIVIREISSQRIYWITLIWFQLITYSVFQGNMIKEVNTADNSRDLQTIQELMDSSLNISIDPSFTTFFKYSEQVTARYNLENRIMMEGLDTPQLLSRLITKRSFAKLLAQDKIEEFVPQFYDNKTGEALLHVIPEVAYEFYSAMYVPLTSPYVETFNRILLQYIDAGLIEYGTDRMTFETQLLVIRRRAGGNFMERENQAATIDLGALKVIIFLVFGLFAVAILVFCGELLIKSMNSKKQTHRTI